MNSKGNNPSTSRALRRARYPVITMKGIQFIERWYTAEHIPPQQMRLYQFLLRLIWMKGTMTTNLARRLGRNKEILKLASSRGYMKGENKLIRPSRAIQDKIGAMIGEAPRWIYA